MKVSIIILTFNSEKYIPTLLSSLTQEYAKQIKEKELEVIVADNSSSDSTLKEVQKFKDRVKVIENGGNLGYAKGNNTAAKKASGDVLLILNPDTKVAEGDIFKLVSEFIDEKVGIIGGKILTWDKRRELSCGKFYTAINILLLSLGLEEKLGVRFAPNSSQKVDFVSGAFLAVRRSLFERLHGFDEHYFMYIEDQDLCFRAFQEGYITLFSPKATIQHMGQASSNRTFAIVNIYKGLSYFQKRHMSKMSYNLSVFFLKTKAILLVILGKISNNQYLANTYEDALKALSRQ